MHLYSHRRNLCVVYVSEASLVALLDWKKPGYLSLPVMRGLPDGTRVVGVHHLPDRRAWAVHCFNASFPEVADHEEIPAYDGWRDATVETVEIVFDQAGPDEPLRVTIPGSAGP